MVSSQELSFSHGLFGNALEAFIGFAGRSLDEHCEALYQAIASPELSKYSGSNLNTHGELILGNADLKEDDQKLMEEYSAQLYSQFVKKNE